MTDLSRSYRYNYRHWLFAGSWRHSYELVGRWGGLHLHIIDYGEDRSDMLPGQYSAGLETHCRQPLRYMQDQPPSHDDCWLLKAPCWHDGTSLYAQERFLPMFDGVDHIGMFRALVQYADDQFSDFAIRDEVAS